MLRTFAGIVYGIALVVACIAVGAGGHGFVTYFGVAAAPFSFYAVRMDKLAMFAAPLFWGTIAFMARVRKASEVFLALIVIHYASAILWLVLRGPSPKDMHFFSFMTPIIGGAIVIYVAGQVILWREYIRRS
jgi:hypothetical protein